MKKIILIMLFLATSVFAQEKKQLPEMASEKPNVALEKVWEIKIDEDVQDIVFNEEEISVGEAKAMGFKGLERLKNRSKIKSFRPKAMITKREIRFLDRDGRIKRKINLLKTIPGKQWSKIKKTKNNKYIGINEVLSYEKEYVKEGKFKMVDIEGDIKWEFEHNFTDIVPSPDGSYVLAMPDPEWGEHPIYLINSKGMKKEIKKAGVGEAYFPFFSPKGNIISVVVDERNMNKTTLIILNKKGDELWRKEEIGKSIGATVNKDYIAVVTQDRKTKEITLSLFDLKGNLLWEYKPFNGTGGLVFSNDYKYLFSICEMYETDSGKLLWRNTDVRGSNVFTTPDLSFILITGSKIVKLDVKPGLKKVSDYFYLINKNGEKLLYEEFDPGYIIFRDYKPVISISSDGKEILIETKEGLEYFKNPFTE